jgi:hypothetical protein
MSPSGWIYEDVESGKEMEGLGGERSGAFATF